MPVEIIGLSTDRTGRGLIINLDTNARSFTAEA